MDLPVITNTRESTVRLPLEIVERKGLGHPDTICDALAEQFSLNLCRYYFEHFGLVLHHNVDKGLLVAGSAKPAFKGGKMEAPIRIILAGRATTSFKGVDVPVVEIAAEAARAWFKKHFHALNPEKDIDIEVEVRPGAPELVELFLRQAKEGGVPLANDTSCGIGFYPLTPLEKSVFEAERLLNSKSFKEKHPAVGQDIKIMGIRRGGSRAFITVACAFVDRFLQGMDDYLAYKEKVRQIVTGKAEEYFEEADISVNAADDPDSNSIYLTVTGTSAESGDDGEVGRGNRVSGLITPMRPMNMEAVSGKNPVNHVGKIYNIKAQQIAKQICQEIDEITECTCLLVSRIGKPVTEPAACEIRVCSEEKLGISLQKKIKDIYRAQMKNTAKLWKEILKGEHLIN